jgi:serine/threonine-protein kinase RsbW/sigma-B regulation protein RsbU (phosphoserine phosphatase)
MERPRSTHRLELTLENRLGAIPDAAAEIRRFCEPLGVSRREISHVNLALDEVLTNVISYGWPQGGSHTVRVALRLEGARLIVEVTDDGVPFDPRAVPEPDLSAPLEERRVGGLGVYFAMTLMDHVDYRRVGDENHLTLIKAIQPRESPRD